jgi:aminoglycoside phosphotransferase family enzyme
MQSAQPSEIGPTHKLSFLASAACGDGTAPQVIETHMSWVFLCRARVLKLKKPVRYDFLDFSTVAAREFNCREEVRLNRRLAPDVYLGVAPLVACADGALRIGVLDPMAGDGAARGPAGDGAAVDWLVCMNRLPAEGMLDRRIAEGTVTSADIDRLADRLALFYRTVPAVALDGAAYLARQTQAQRINRAVLLDARFADAASARALDRFDRALRAHGELLAARARAGRIRDGHGDLRPEHVALDAVPAVIDCLEFNRTLREVDPFDELAFLGLECRLLGAPWIGARLIERVAAALDDRPPDALLALYTASRALLRARLAAAHLLEADARTPARWLPQARNYVALANETLDGLPA